MANAIPPNANKIVFAYDVFNHILKRVNHQMTVVLSASSIAKTVGNYRAHTNVVFNDRVKQVCDDLDKTQKMIVEKDFKAIMTKHKSINKEYLVDYCRTFRESCFDVGFNPSNFMVYCTRIAAISCTFYGHGLTEAADIAINLIVSALPDDPNWANLLINFTYDTERRMDTEEPSSSTNQNYSRREPRKLISSETEESSTDSISICESDSISTDKFNQSEGSSETEGASVVPQVVVEKVTAGISELTLSNFDQTCDITEESGISSLSSPVALPGSSLSSPVALPGSSLSSPVALSGSNPSPVAFPGSDLLDVPVTRSSSISPRKRSFPKEDTTHSQPKNLSDELAKPTSSLGKRRSTGKDDRVSSNIPESAAEKDETAEDVFAPSESKKPKIEDPESAAEKDETAEDGIAPSESKTLKIEEGDKK